MTDRQGYSDLGIEDLQAISWVRAACRTGEAKRIRTDANVSGAEIADAIGTTEAAVNGWERGERTPRRHNAIAYARILRSLAGTTVGAADLAQRVAFRVADSDMAALGVWCAHKAAVTAVDGDFPRDYVGLTRGQREAVGAARGLALDSLLETLEQVLEQMLGAEWLSEIERIETSPEVGAQ